MDYEANSRHKVLELILLDENARPSPLPLSILEDITNHFSHALEIGKGGFAVVYKGIVGKGTVAVKKLTRTHDLPESKFHKEVECLMKAKHKNIVRFLGYCVETQGEVHDYEGKFIMADQRSWLLCFEYLPNGSLEKYITNASSGLEWRERFRIIKGICEGLQYLHVNRIIHLDLKPANILLDRHMTPKIVDFGISRCLDENKSHVTTKDMSGTPGYVAPERFNGAKITFASDIYSLGVVIMEILTGVKGHPEDDNVTESWMNRLEGNMQLEQVSLCTKIAIKCMESDPKKRPDTQHIITILDQTEQYSLAQSVWQRDIKKHPDSDDSAEEDTSGNSGARYQDPNNENDHSQEEEGNTDNGGSSWEAQDTEQKVNHKGKSIFSASFGVWAKLNILRVFRTDAQRNFVKNGGLVLKNIRGLTFFTKGDIKKITRNYSNFLGRGPSATVYKGTLPDSTMVAVKTFMWLKDGAKEEIGKGMVIQTQMIHMNISKLIGCCLEVDVPILVYEYAPNGSLRDILHGKENPVLPLDLRLDIAVGSAEGLRHMHAITIRHGDVHPENILLDEKLRPKLSGFYLLKLIEEGSFTKFVIGNRYYMDPVFMSTGLLTVKSDVYNFGVVLMELITRKRNEYNANGVLIEEYRKCYEIEKSGRSMFDETIAAEEDMPVLEEIGKLAIHCLNEDVEGRPDMMEVTRGLAVLRRDRRAGKAQQRIQASPSY